MRSVNVFSLLFFITFISLSKLSYATNHLTGHFFPSTIYINDPYVTDKLILSEFRSESPASSGGHSWTSNPQVLYGKTITKDLIFSVTGSYLHIQNPGQATQNGFDNWEVGARYNVLHLPQTESIISLGINAAIGGTGSQIVNADSSTTISTQLLFAQDFINLPDDIKYLKPFALFMEISPKFVTNNYSVTSIDVGAAIEYSLPFLQQYINHIHSPWMEHLVPIIEFPFTFCTQGSCAGQTTGTINPGFIVLNKYGQVGVEALIPGNRHTGSKIGYVLQLHLYLESLLPDSIGKPIF